MSSARIWKPVLLALAVVMALLGSVNPTGASTPEIVPEDSVPLANGSLGLSVPADKGLALSEQGVDGRTLDHINRIKNQPESSRLSYGVQASCVNTCNGKDPVEEGCDDGATLREYIDNVDDTRFFVQLRFSSECGSIWSRARYMDGPIGRVLALQTREMRTETTSNRDPSYTSDLVQISGHSSGWVWTTMLTAPGWPNVRACSRPSWDGRQDFLECSRAGYTSLISSRGLCLDVPYRQFNTGQRVWIYDCHGYANLAQMWQVRPDGTLRVGDVNGNMKCLRVDRNRGGDAIPLVLHPCRNWGSMTWRYEPDGQIVNSAKGRRCVDVPNNTNERMTYVQVWTCMVYTSNNQPINAQRFHSPQTAWLDGLH